MKAIFDNIDINIVELFSKQVILDAYVNICNTS